MVATAVALGALATTDATTLRPGAWTLTFSAVLVLGALTSALLFAGGARWSDRSLALVVVGTVVLVVVSVLANQDRSASLLNVVLFLPGTVFAAVALPPAQARATTAAMLVGLAVVVVLVTGDPVQWVVLVGLPALAFVGTAEVVLRMRLQLECTARALERQSTTDPLTGLLNRRVLADLVGAPGTATGVRTVVLLDIDHFKVVNDTLGHAVGDEVLRRVGAGLARDTREDDVVVRMGGEEFLVLSRTPPDRAAEFAEMLRVRAAGWMGEWSATVSIGAVTTPDAGPRGLTGPELEAAVRAADGHLYAAKRGGRDRMVLDTWSAATTLHPTA